MSFDASVVIPSVYFAIVNNLVAMQMTMNVAPVVSRKARWMHWYMREDKTASHGGITRMKESSPYVFKIFSPFRKLYMLVMIAFNENFPAIKPSQNA